MVPFPRFPTRTAHDLSGVWDFAFLGEADFDSIDPASVAFSSAVDGGVLDDSACGFGQEAVVVCAHPRRRE
jgi:hypothetical protein